MTAALTLFIRLIVRPLGREPGRTALTIFAIALGVAVVVAIHLAGNAATGSFQSSLETLTGDADLEISAVGAPLLMGWFIDHALPQGVFIACGVFLLGSFAASQVAARRLRSAKAEDSPI